MDIYVLVYCGRVLGVSARLQGAELMRADAAREFAKDLDGNVTDEDYQGVYGRISIENHDLQDCD